MENKKLVLIQGPLGTRSGYGDHSRSLYHALDSTGKYDIKVVDLRWGDTPRDALDKNIPSHKKILDSILKEPILDRQPDLFFQVSIPNEAQQVGKWNCLITAGMETTAVSKVWLEKCNQMDLIIVPSEHSKNSFINTVYDAIQNQPDGTQVKTGEVKLQKPIEVIFEGMDENIFRSLKVSEIDKKFLNHINDIIKEDFAFLFMGQWVKGNYGEDRKDIGRLIKVFCESFANEKKQPALILKTSGATFSHIDQVETIKKIRVLLNKFPSDWKLPNIYLLHGDLTEEEMNLLYNHPKIKCMVSFTHGEGFGRPLLEASMVGLPVIASYWSGHIDFLDEKYSILLKGKLETVPKAAVWEDIIIPESQWFVIDEHQAYTAFRHAFENKYEIKEKAKTLMGINRKKYTLDKMSELFNKIIDDYTKHIATLMSLKLPKLKKVENNKSDIPTITLPKLKKLT